MVANPHPLWSLAWNQLPFPHLPISLIPFPPPWPILNNNNDINNFGLLDLEQQLIAFRKSSMQSEKCATINNNNNNNNRFIPHPDKYDSYMIKIITIIHI
jgi:hypothetical protein